MTAFYAYIHTRNDSNAIFYVGKGKGDRAHDMDGRNSDWYKIVAMRGYTVHIVESFESENDAYALERYLIESFRACGVGLCNIASGGSGGDRKSGRPKGPPSIPVCVRILETDYAELMRLGGVKAFKEFLLGSLAQECEPG